jgi:predicted small secreted protein
MKTITLLLAAAATLFLASCQTMQGFGRDMQRGGNYLENSAAR